jgi:hypothetical protein
LRDGIVFLARRYRAGAGDEQGRVGSS